MIQEAFEGGAEKIKEFQHAMDDDIERGEKLKSELVRDGWGGRFNKEKNYFVSLRTQLR